MKRVFSLLILLIVLFLGFEIIVNHFTKSYKNNYKVYSDDKIFEVIEQYEKKNNDKYDIEILADGKSFYYTVSNDFNKQKQIINKILYFKNGDSLCIYPVLKNNIGTYIECASGSGTLYMESAYQDTNFIATIKEELASKKYIETPSAEDLAFTTEYSDSKFYQKNIPEKDMIIYWKYKGITIFNKSKNTQNLPLAFDKYENKTGALVGKYYIIPEYRRSNILEFSSIYKVDITTNKKEKIELGYTLSSDTYINGIVDDKLYYTDPSNLLQIEINPNNSKVRLIGNEKLGGQMYDGEWKDRNIYDFRNATIYYTNLNDLSNYNYKYAEVGDNNYYYVDNNGNVYLVPKLHLDKKILLFKTNLNNFNVVDDDIYYVNNNTVYYYTFKDGIRPALINQDLIYNTANRISIYRGK